MAEHSNPTTTHSGRTEGTEFVVYPEGRRWALDLVTTTDVQALPATNTLTGERDVAYSYNTSTRRVGLYATRSHAEREGEQLLAGGR